MRGHDIVCFAADDWWLHHPHADVHLMQELAAAGNRVLYVNSTGIRRPDLAGDPYARGRALRKIASLLRYVRKVAPGFYVFSPLALPLMGGAFVQRCNSAALSAQVAAVMAVLRFRAPIIWATSPMATHTAVALRRRVGQCLVYCCADSLSRFPGIDGERVLALELDLHRQADVAFFVSHALLEERKHQNPNSRYLAHGVDYDHFARAQHQQQPVPHDLQGVTGPIAGYMGEIRWLDTGLIRRLATENPDISFVLIGNVEQDVEDCRRPNVHFLGPKSYSELPAYLQCFSCCLICYQADEAFNQYRNPKKLLEYLATGKPVVSVDIPEMRRVEAYVRVAEDAASFSRHVREAVQDGDSSGRARRIDLARQHTWRTIAGNAARHIQSAIADGQLS